MKKNFMTKLVGMLAGIIYIIFGFLMISNPTTTLRTLSVVMAWVVLISGTVSLALAFMFKGIDDELKRSNMSDGVLLLVLGLIFMFGNFINNTLILAYLLIIWIIMDSAFQLQLSAFIPSTGSRLLVIAIDVFIIAYGVWLLFNPNAAEGFLVLYTGVGFMSTGVGKIVKSL